MDNTRTPASSGNGRRERNKQRVRERIYDSAIELFAAGGYEATSVDDIANHADVSRGTFFNYFQRKEDLIAAWVHDWRTRVLERMRQSQGLEDASARTLLQLYMASIAEQTESQRKVTEFMLPAWVKTGSPLNDLPYTAEVFTETLQRGVDRGEFIPATNTKLVGAMLRDLYLGALFRWVTRPSSTGELAAELREVLHVLLEGIADPPHWQVSREGLVKNDIR
ncbi:TetR family transcriptional regulator [Rhodococcus sp. KBW08]|uniref:TetR/AcrR family transcriptional regulator n=1 Tax=Rhodococcus sp. KBW08 TaxID=2144188 RepID=UPI000F592998|nr:TetR/AcrR family transcriptional regulator [Rhodococcus sp. KBW08]RQO50013.1 TetR family transcriptional regulator [Rhodococcus sp. KBW08]